MPGNICVDSTVPLNRPRPWNRYRLIAYPANSASVTEQAVAASDTTRLFTKYLPSGTVFQISTNGRAVSVDGNQVNGPCTSRSGFSEDSTITYTGSRVNAASTVSTTLRTQRNHGGTITRPSSVRR